MTAMDGLEAVVRDVCLTRETARRIACLLDLSPDEFTSGSIAPTGWHFPLIGSETPRSILRADGFPGLGIPMPQLGLARVLAGGREVTYHGVIVIDAPLVRTSVITKIREKQSSNGPLAIVDVEHHICDAQNSALLVHEKQSYVLLSSVHAPKSAATDQAAAPVAEVAQTVRLDDVFLFQFSALSFNSHKIHLDRRHAASEGYPDLVVNGGISTLLMTELARARLDRGISAIRVTNKAPLFVDRDISLTIEQSEYGARICAYTDEHVLAAEMELS